MKKPIDQVPNDHAGWLRLLVTPENLRRMERYARRHLGDEASAQDVVQATLEVLLKAKTDFRGESSYSTYAFGILRHKIGDVLRDRKRYVSLQQVNEDEEQSEIEIIENQHDVSYRNFTGPEDHAHSKRLGQAIQKGLLSLSPRGRQVFIMRERLGLGGDEISQQMGLTMSNAWVLLFRAKRQLRDSLIGQGYGFDKSDSFNV